MFHLDDARICFDKRLTFQTFLTYPTSAKWPLVSKLFLRFIVYFWFSCPSLLAGWSCFPWTATVSGTHLERPRVLVQRHQTQEAALCIVFRRHERAPLDREVGADQYFLSRTVSASIIVNNLSDEVLDYRSGIDECVIFKATSDAMLHWEEVDSWIGR